MENLPVNQYIVGDCLEVMKGLPAESVQCVVTSPPYWGLRSYSADGQYGLESTPESHIAKMVEVFRDVRRVLRKDGVCWLNYGDSYATNTSAGDKVFGNPEFNKNRPSRELTKTGGKTVPIGLKPKDLCMIPARVAIALQADGWWIRSEIIWFKKNPMPESCTDRPTSSHEKIYLLTKAKNYFYDADAVREKATHPGDLGVLRSKIGNGNPYGEQAKSRVAAGVDSRTAGSENRNLRNVWTIPTHPTPDAHFATFPPALVKRCVLAGTSHKACEVCGAPWERVVEKSGGVLGGSYLDHSKDDTVGKSRINYGSLATGGDKPYTRDTTGFRPTCDCTQNGTGKCVVLDPFMGSGTTAKVAQELGRDWVGIDLGGKDGEYKRIFDKKMQGATIGLF